MKRIILCLIIGLVFVSLTSILPFLPIFLKSHQPWLILLVILILIDIRLAIVLSVIFGWYLDLFSPLANGIYLITIPATVMITFYLSIGWKSRRIWLMIISRVFIATVLYYLLFFGLEYGYDFFIAKKNLSEIDVGIINTIISSIVVNSIIAVITYKMIHRLLPNIDSDSAFSSHGYQV